MSPKGRLFIIRHEGQHGVSNHLHHPSFGSGVTLGPGYGMKDRSRAQVAGDLKSVFGVDPAVAGRVAEGAGLQGNAAAAFVRNLEGSANPKSGGSAPRGNAHAVVWRISLMPRYLTSVAFLFLSTACGNATDASNDAATALPAGDAPAAHATVSASSEVRPDEGAPSASASGAAPSAGPAEAAFARQLAAVLVDHATLDGREVTGVRAIDKCHTAFITAGGETVIDWAKADNPAPRNAGGREITQLPGKDGSHSMSAEQGDLPEPGGNAANRSTGAFGQLALDCGG